MLMRFVFFSGDFSEVITTRVSFAANTSKNKLQVLINKRDPRRACTEFILRLKTEYHLEILGLFLGET